MHTVNRTPAWLVHRLESSVPFEGLGSRTCHRSFMGGATSRTLTRKMACEDCTVQILFLGTRSVDGKSFRRNCELLIGHLLGCICFDGINPTIPDSIAE